MEDLPPAPGRGGTQAPLAARAATAAVARCVVATFAMLVRRRVHLPRAQVGRRLCFGDGTTARVYRVTSADVGSVRDPCVLVVGFRLRWVHGRGHAVFRAESLLNTPLFVGFPGFVSKLWLAHDQNQLYRGVYDWDGPERAERYARALWRVLALVSEPGSIRFRVRPGVRRDELLVALATPVPVDGGRTGAPDWWRVVAPDGIAA